LFHVKQELFNLDKISGFIYFLIKYLAIFSSSSHNFKINNKDDVMSRKIINSQSAPEPIGPYSQAIISGNLIFTSGQIPIDPASGEVLAADISAQTRQVIENLSAVLTAAGSSLNAVLKTTIFLKNMSDFTAVNEVYATFFGKTLPARSTVEVARLPKDVGVEIECIASID
jgi:2-iminobutanoate/2-iminopropanoate deaminase